MAGRWSDGWLDELRAQNDIVSLVSEYVALKPKGRGFWGLCPFHSEKSASFKVDADSQLYYCFGCHKGGNVINFVMELERMEFYEAVKYLAERAHMPIPEQGEREAPRREEKEAIYRANTAAARYFHDLIWREAGAKALNYLKKRGLSDGDVRRFGLGASGSDWQGLLEALKEQGFGEDVLVKAGLVVRKENRCFDMFRDRAMFPIIDQQGRVLGFGGRILGEGNPKYLNTPDTPVFNKRNGLYAMNFLRKERALDHLVLVEGYMDAVSLRRAGVQGVVATLGTALTEEQARLMKRYAPEVYVGYDGDAPGQKAILRALDICEGQDYRARVLVFPEGMDPDDFIRAKGAEGFAELAPLDPTAYRMQRAMDGVDMQSEEGRTQYAIACCQFIKRLRNPVEMENHLRRLARQTGFERETLLKQIGVVAPETPAARKPRPPRSKEVEGDKGCMAAERALIALLAAGMIPRDAVRKEDFETALYADMAQWLIEGLSPAAVMDRVPEAGRDMAAEALNREVPVEEQRAMDVAKDSLERIRRTRAEARIARMTDEMRSADDQDKRALAMAIIKLRQEMKA